MSETVLPASVSGSKQIFKEIALFILLFLAAWMPRAAQLDQFVTPDEHLWLSRSANFYMALAQRDFASTYQKEHPGVSVMWTGALAYLLEYPEYRGSGLGQLKQMQFDYYIEKLSDVPPLEILHTARLLIATIISLVLVISFFYARRLMGLIPALLGFILISYDPFLLALTRILHLDGLMSCLYFLAMLSFIGYIQSHRWFDLVISGIAAAFCWLTKSPGFILGVNLVLLLGWVLWQERSAGKGVFWRAAGRLVRDIIIWGGIAAVVYFVFWPAMWVAPQAAITNVFAEALGYAKSGHHSSIFFNGMIFPDGNIGWEYFGFYPITFVWRTTPVVMFGLLTAAWGYIARRRPFLDPRARLVVFGMTWTVILFTLVLTIGTKKFDRYLLPIYLPLDLIAGMGIAGVLYWVGERVKRISFKLLSIFFVGGVFLIQASLALQTFPYYFSYYNPLMGGTARAPGVMQIGWGEGLDQAAEYLNKKENVEQLKVISWYNDGGFSYYFDGISYDLGARFPSQPEDWDGLLSADYLVIYIHQWQRDLPGELLDYLRPKTPEHTIWINGLEYIRIYKLP